MSYGSKFTWTYGGGTLVCPKYLKTHIPVKSTDISKDRNNGNCCVPDRNKIQENDMQGFQNLKESPDPGHAPPPFDLNYKVL